MFPGGIIIFPLSYILGDVLTEVYGYARARHIIWVGFIANILMILVYIAVIALPSAPFWHKQEAIQVILGQVPRLVIGSIAGYWVGEFSNSFVLAKMKVWTEGRYLWTRTIGSTIVGQGLDTSVFVMVAFAGVIPSSELLITMISVYLFKVIYEVIATPITYTVVGFLKKAESVDYYDKDTKFSPFKL